MHGHSANSVDLPVAPAFINASLVVSQKPLLFRLFHLLFNQSWCWDACYNNSKSLPFAPVSILTLPQLPFAF